MITLNTDQEIAANKIVDFIEGRIDAPYFTLTGGPGTGKSFLLKEALSRTNSYQFNRSAAAVAHAAKNVISDAFDDSIPCYTVAQWLGMKMVYTNTGEIDFVRNKKAIPKLNASKIAILDEASMINDSLYHSIMQIVQTCGLKLIIVGDIFQMPPVKQEHDSKFFDRIDAELTIPMRFLGPITDVSKVYREAIEEINKGYASDPYILNSKTNRQDNYDSSIDSGYYFKNDIYELVEQVGEEIKNNPKDTNFSRVLAYKNTSIDLLNKNIRKYIYGSHLDQFEEGEIVISKGGFSVGKMPIIRNGKILRVEKTLDIIGPYNIPCLSMKFKDLDSGNVVVVKDNTEALDRYNNIKNELLKNGENDYRQWVYYYKFIDSFAYFDYAYSTTLHKAQGQTLTNVYVMEGEVMDVRPLTLKQKFQALYVAMTRASKNLYIYNKNY